MSTTTTELRPISVHTSASNSPIIAAGRHIDQFDTEQNDNVSSLPPVDRGKDAWLFIAGSFMVEAMVWGFAFCFGVFQEYYSTKSQFAHQKNIAIIGSSTSGIMYLSAPVMMGLIGRYPAWSRTCMIVGYAITILALITASFAQSITVLILTQGVGYAIGGSLIYCPCMIYMDEWFVAKKGLAVGVMWAGNGAAGAVLPLILNALLEKYGFRVVLRAWAVATLLSAVPILYCVKPRLPVARDTGPKRISVDFLFHSTFWYYQAANVLSGLGYFLPGIYLPAYASSINMNRVMGSLVLSLLNLTSVFGQVFWGAVVDYLNAYTVMLLISLGATLAVFLLWGFSISAPILICFALVYGLTAGGYSSTWTGSINHVVREKPTEKSFVFGLLAAGRGIGNVMAGPLSEALLRAGSNHGATRDGFGYSSYYSVVIIFCGVTAAFGSIGWLGMGTPRRLFSVLKI